MTKKQYVRREIIKRVILVDVSIVVAGIIGYLIIPDIFELQDSVQQELAFRIIIALCALIIPVGSAVTGLITYLDKYKYEEKFYRMESKKYVEKMFLQSDRFEITKLNCTKYSNFFGKLHQSGEIHFFANVDPDSNYVRITAKSGDSDEEEFERITKEEFLSCYQ